MSLFDLRRGKYLFRVQTVMDGAPITLAYVGAGNPKESMVKWGKFLVQSFPHSYGIYNGLKLDVVRV